MKICIPTMDNEGLDSTISGHFGKSPMFTLFDTETKIVTTIENQSDHRGGVGSPPDHLAKHGVNILLASGAGGHAITTLEGKGIKVYLGCRGKVRDALEQWKSGTLEEGHAGNSCKEHHHDH